MAIPVFHIERLVANARSGEDETLYSSVDAVDAWLDEVKREPAYVLSEVMEKIGNLPMYAGDFLGKDLYDRVQVVLGYEVEPEGSDEGEDDED